MSRLERVLTNILIALAPSVVPAVERQKRDGKTVTFGNRPGTLTRITDRRHVTVFKQRNSRRLTGHKIGLSSLFEN